jgi:hypothetical protein
VVESSPQRPAPGAWLVGAAVAFFCARRRARRR